ELGGKGTRHGEELAHDLAGRDARPATVEKPELFEEHTKRVFGGVTRPRLLSYGVDRVRPSGPHDGARDALAPWLEAAERAHPHRGAPCDLMGTQDREPSLYEFAPMRWDVCVEIAVLEP